MPANSSPITHSVNLNRRHAADFLREAYERLQALDTAPTGGVADADDRIWNVMDAYSAAMMAQWLFYTLDDQEAADRAWNLCDRIAGLLIG